MYSLLILIFVCLNVLPSSESLDDCVDGSPACIIRTIDEMESRLNTYIYKQNCNRNAPFLLSYLIMTTTFRDMFVTQNASNVTVFTDNLQYNQNLSRVNRRFANLYFQARDRWTGKATQPPEQSLVPEAWRIAFRAADNQELSVFGDFMVAVNAHINRDLAYGLSAVIGADGSPGLKRDFDVINNVFDLATNTSLYELAQQFDPTFLAVYNNFTGTAFAAVVKAWREIAWRNAERIVACNGNRVCLTFVEQTIEIRAATQGRLYATLFPDLNPRARNAYCRAQHGLAK